MEEDILKDFNKTAISLLKLSGVTGDSFFSKKLEAKTGELILNGIKLLSKKNTNEIDLNITFSRILFLADYISEVIKDMQYLGISTTGPSQLLCQKNLLQLKLSLLKNKNALTDVPVVAPVTRTESAVAPTVIHNVKETVPAPKKTKLNKSKKMIFDYIKNYPNSRTKDIIHEFSAVSDRTVKRNLIDLTRSGLIKKRMENKAVFYSATNV